MDQEHGRKKMRKEEARKTPVKMDKTTETVPQILTSWRRRQRIHFSVTIGQPVDDELVERARRGTKQGVPLLSTHCCIHCGHRWQNSGWRPRRQSHRRTWIPREQNEFADELGHTAINRNTSWKTGLALDTLLLPLNQATLCVHSHRAISQAKQGATASWSVRTVWSSTCLVLAAGAELIKSATAAQAEGAGTVPALLALKHKVNGKVPELMCKF